MSEARKSNGLKLGVAIALLLGGLVFVYARYQSSRPTPATRPQAFPPAAPSTGSTADSTAANRTTAGSATDGPLNGFISPADITPQQRQQFREEIYQKLDLTAEQRARLDAINKKYDAEEGGTITRETFIARLREAAEVLTPEQRDKARLAMREQFRQRIAERIKVLPADEQRAFMEKFDKRFEEGRQQFESGGQFGGAGAGQPQVTPAQP